MLEIGLQSVAAIKPGAALLGALTLVGLGLWVAWPQRGLAARWRRAKLLRERVRAEDALKHIFNTQSEQRAATLESLAGATALSLNAAAAIVAHLQNAEWVVLTPAGLRLTPAGERYALNVVRAHRLWEQHLAEQTGVAESQWHKLAEKQEHFITPQQADMLSAGLGHPAYDPHGDPIPNRHGDIPARDGQPLSAAHAEQWVRILHVEDEPEQVCAQIRAMGLYPGTVARLLECGPQRIRLWCDGQEQVLAPIVAANVSVEAVPETQAPIGTATTTLSELPLGGKAQVVRLAHRCRGAERRRLMDLGILPGTVLTNEMRSPAGQLNAYRVRDTLIALRQEQADLIQVSAVGQADNPPQPTKTL